MLTFNNPVDIYYYYYYPIAQFFHILFCKTIWSITAGNSYVNDEFLAYPDLLFIHILGYTKKIPQYLKTQIIHTFQGFNSIKKKNLKITEIMTLEFPVFFTFGFQDVRKNTENGKKMRAIKDKLVYIPTGLLRGCLLVGANNSLSTSGHPHATVVSHVCLLQ